MISAFSKKYCDCLLEIYPKECIFVNETYLCGHYIDEKGKIYPFPINDVLKYKKLNNKLKRIYSALKQYLNQDNFIRQSDANFSDKNHKWGLAPFHYYDKYYENLINQMKIKLKIEEVQ